MKAEEEARKIEEAKKTIHESGQRLGRNAASNFQSSGAGSATITSEYTDDIEEEKKDSKAPTKQVDR